MGALTSSPYAFTARPWELLSTDTVDVLDGMGSSIRVQSKGGEVMRVLPRENDDINEEWITDKTRFAYDGLKRQRLTRPLVRSAAEPSKWDDTSSTWRGAFARVAAVMGEKKAAKPDGFKLRCVVGASTDLYSALALTDWAAQVADADVETLGSVGGAMRADLPSQYRFNSTIRGLEDTDYCLLVGTALDIEAPLLVSRLRKGFLRDSVEVVSVGMPVDLAFPSASAGLTAATLEEIAGGQHPVWEGLQAAEKPSIIVSSNVFKREDGAALAGVLEKILASTPKMRTPEWDGFNVLHHSANDVGLLDLGRTVPFNPSSASAADTDVLFLLNVNEDELPVPLEELVGDETFVVVQGTHGDALASRADVVLPGAAFSEKAGVYVNFEGRAQQGRLAVGPPVDAREDWKIIRGLSEAVGGSDGALPYNSTEEVAARLELLVPGASKLGALDAALSPAQLFDEAAYAKLVAERCKGAVNKTPFTPALYDYHLEGSVIAKSSTAMAKGSQEYPGASNFRDMAA